MSRKINVGQVLQDLKDGMHDTAIMAKYNLSPGQLQTLYGKLAAAGLWKREEATTAKPENASAEDAPFVCPSCGMPQSRSFDECPQCGVIVSKLPPPLQPHGAAADSPSDSDSDRLHQGTVYPASGSGLLLVSCVTAALLLVVGALAYFLWPGGSGPEGQSAAGKAAQRAHPGQSSTAARGVKEPMKYIKNLPRLREINPAVDREIHKSFRDVDKSLSKGRDQLDRVMEGQ